MNKQSTYAIPISIDGLQFYHHDQPFELELGNRLASLTVAYHTYGQLNESKDNVIWVCHALTANSDVKDWWSGLFGAGKLFDPEKYFIVCANILGSCYGTTCARSINPSTDVAYGLDFPLISIRDMVRAHDLLRQDLGIQKIEICIGGSCGGHQVLEYDILFPTIINRMILLVTSAKESGWAIAIHEAGRMALEADPTFFENKDAAGKAGLRGARAVGLLAYRTNDAYMRTQSDHDERTKDFSASSYIRYQGEKLERRFYAHAYWSLLNTLDTHYIGRGRGGSEKVLSEMTTPALIIGIDTDQLIPTSQQKMLAEHLPNASYREITSVYGHDGFLIESDKIMDAINGWI